MKHYIITKKDSGIKKKNYFFFPKEFFNSEQYGLEMITANNLNPENWPKG